jgi:hypothetical protein
MGYLSENVAGALTCLVENWNFAASKPRCYCGVMTDFALSAAVWLLVDILAF